MRSASALGSSSMIMCPAFEIRTSSDPSMAAESLAARRGGVRRSRDPTTTVVGTVIR